MENEENNTTELEVVEVKEEKIEDGVEEKRPTLTLPEKPAEKDTITVDGIEYPKELIDEAKKEGWRDKSFLKGKGMDNKFLDPATFIERGKKAVPFLNKKITEKDNEIETLKGMMKSIMADGVKDRMERVNKDIEQKKEYGEDYETLVEKKLQLKNDLTKFDEVEVPPVPPQLQKPLEIRNWEMENDWVYDNSQYNSKKAQYATDTLVKIGFANPDLSTAQHLSILDLNLASYDSKIQQKANVSVPVESQSSGRITPTETKSIANLTSKYKGHWEDCCRDARGNKFTGKSLESAKEVFLDSCSDECFKK